MEIVGIVKQILNTETKGTPPKQLKVKKIIVETDSKFPQVVAVDFINKNIDKLTSCKVGDPVVVKVNLRSIEYKERWYSNIIGWAINSRERELESKEQLPDSNDLPW